MDDFLDIAAKAVGLTKGLVDLTGSVRKSLGGRRVDPETTAKLGALSDKSIELKQTIIQLQQMVLTLQKEEAAMQKELVFLREQNAQLQTASKKAQTPTDEYELTACANHTSAYRKRHVRDGEHPQAYFCTPCYEKGVLRHLSFVEKDWNFDRMTCPTCGTDVCIPNGQSREVRFAPAPPRELD